MCIALIPSQCVGRTCHTRVMCNTKTIPEEKVELSKYDEVEALECLERY
jgi:hypothetical protein